VVVNDPGFFVSRLCKPRQQIGVFPQGGIDEEAGDRRQFCGKGIQRLLRARGVTQRAKHRKQVTVAVLYRAQSLEGRKHLVACGFERGLYACEFFGPISQPWTDGLQRLIRRAGGYHDRLEIRRIEMPRDETKRFERLQQRRQHGHDVVHHGLAHRKPPPAFNAAAAA
jgi:hypothetical protein